MTPVSYPAINNIRAVIWDHDRETHTKEQAGYTRAEYKKPNEHRCTFLALGDDDGL